MSITYREKRPYRILKQIDKSLKQYDVTHPTANIELDRRNNVSVPIRIIDQDFRGKSRAEREREIWPLFDVLSEDAVADITMLLHLTPEEQAESLASFEFDHPTKSLI
jgi:acid stress-induced BolA-like protein IbaG/YrbA